MLNGTRAQNAKNLKADINLSLHDTCKKGERTESEKRYGNGGYFLEINSEQTMCGHYFTNAEDSLNPYASPLLATDVSKLPPACFVSAECDPILDQALIYAAKLQDAGVEVEYHLITGMLHGFINRPYQKIFESFDKIIATIP